MGEKILTDGDIAEVFAGRDTFDEETVARFARYMSKDPGLAPQRKKMRAQALDAGLDPEKSPEAFDLARSFFRDFEALLARDDWDDPLEVLDAGGFGPGTGHAIGHAGYEELISIASAQAERVKDPARILAVKGKIERAHSRLKRCYRYRDGFLKSLGQINERVAADVISEAVFRFSRSLRELVESSTEKERLQHATDLVEEQLDLLVAATRWSHPVQVLDKPRAEFSALLRACRLRLFSAQGESQKRLQAVQKKLERAIRIAGAARRRRAAMGH